MGKTLNKLEIENRILKECGCAYSASLGEKLSALEKLHGKYSVHALCRALNVNRATFYNHILRRPEKTMAQIEEDRLRPAIREIHEQTEGRLGSKKIRIKLMERGFKVSAKKVSQLMKELGLSVQHYVKKRIPNRVGGRHNRLNQHFNPPTPNIAWCGDITRLKVLGSDFYLCVVIELYSRKVLAYRISDINSSSFVIEALAAAFGARGRPKGLLFHSDQGVQYMAYSFREYLHQNGIRQSLSKPGCPYDNAVVESFFHSLKCEEASRVRYSSREQLAERICDYIHFFNNDRPHQSLGYRTPQQVEMPAQSKNWRAKSGLSTK